MGQQQNDFLPALLRLTMPVRRNNGVRGLHINYALLPYLTIATFNAQQVTFYVKLETPTPMIFTFVVLSSTVMQWDMRPCTADLRPLIWLV